MLSWSAVLSQKFFFFYDLLHHYEQLYLHIIFSILSSPNL